MPAGNEFIGREFLQYRPRPLGWHNCCCYVSLSDLGSVDLRFSVLP
jgi:hypothetical protein